MYTLEYGPCTRGSVWPVYTGRAHGCSVHTTRHHGQCVPNLTLPPAEIISPAIGLFGLKMHVHEPAECRRVYTTHVRVSSDMPGTFP